MTEIDKYTDSSREWDKKARYRERDIWQVPTYVNNCQGMALLKQNRMRKTYVQE